MGNYICKIQDKEEVQLIPERGEIECLIAGRIGRLERSGEKGGGDSLFPIKCVAPVWGDFESG
jgi:hypothetical protein